MLGVDYTFVGLLNVIKSLVARGSLLAGILGWLAMGQALGWGFLRILGVVRALPALTMFLRVSEGAYLDRFWFPSHETVSITLLAWKWGGVLADVLKGT